MSRRVKTVAYMFGLTLLFTLAVSAVKLSLDQRIKANQSLKLKRVIMIVLGLPVAGKTDSQLLALYGGRVKEISADGRTLYLGYGGPAGALSGIAFKVGGPGFWGPIQGLAAADPAGKKLKGLAFYRHNETPGLGGRITEPWFAKQFQGLLLAPKAAGQIFRLSPPAASKPAGELDAITGASETSKAVARFLNKDLARFTSLLKNDPAVKKSLLNQAKE